MAELDRIERLIERLKAQASFYDDLREWDAPSGALDREASDALRLLLDELAHLRAERDEAREWARGWHRIVETTCTILGLSPALGGDESATALQAEIVARARKLYAIEAERDELREERDMWKGRAQAAVMLGRSIAGMP